MLERTKKRPIDEIELCFTGPANKRGSAVEALKALGFAEAIGDSDWRELFPEFRAEAAYGVALRGARKKEGLTQKQLAVKASIPQGHVSLMENGKMPIGKERARRLAEALNVDYRIFL